MLGMISSGSPRNKRNPSWARALCAISIRAPAIIVPMSVLMATSTWLAHPKLGYELAAKELRAVIEAGDTRPRRLAQPTDAAWDAYDRLGSPDDRVPASIHARRGINLKRMTRRSLTHC